MTPQEELEALRRLAELQAAAPEPSNLPGFAKESAGSVGRGFGNTAINALSSLPLIQLTGSAPAFREAGRGMLNRAIPEAPGTYNRMMEGFGAGLPFGGVIPGVSGAMGEVASETAGEFLANQHPMVKKLGQIAAGLTVGGLTGAGLGRVGNPKPTPSEDLQRDTQTLTELGLNRAGPKTSGQSAANMTEDAATKYFKDAANNRTGMFEAQVAGESVKRMDLQKIYLAAQRAADSIMKTGRGEQAEALRAAANRLLTGDQKNFITNLQELSLSLKELKANPPSLNASTGAKIDSKNYEQAVSSVESALEAVAPAFKSANTVYGTASKMIDTAKSGALGKLADKTPFTADPAPLGKLEAVVGGSNPSEITQTMAALKASGASPEVIARALLDKRLASGPLRPGEKAFGAPGSDKAEQMATLLLSAGKDPAKVRAPLDVADRLARVSATPEAVKEFATIGPGGINLRAMAKPGFFQARGEKHVANEEIAKLLANAEYPKLANLLGTSERDLVLQLSKFDPKVRLYMALSGMAVPAMSDEVK